MRNNVKTEGGAFGKNLTISSQEYLPTSMTLYPLQDSGMSIYGMYRYSRTAEAPFSLPINF